MEEPELILNELFGDRRPPLGPQTESPCEVDHHEPTSDLTNELDLCESLTLGRFLAHPTVDGVLPPVASVSAHKTCTEFHETMLARLSCSGMSQCERLGFSAFLRRIHKQF